MPANQPDTPVRRIFDMAFNQGNFAILEELLRPDSLVNIPAWGLPSNRTGLKLFIASLRTALPDLHCTIEDEVLEAGKLAAHWTMRGSHQGPFLGNPPSGKSVEVQGTLFARTLEGLIVELWVQLDQMSILQQLGIVPPTGGGI